MATYLARAMAQPWVWLEHIRLALIQPRRPTRRRSATVTGSAKGSARRPGSEATCQVLRPATRSGLGSMLWGLLASAMRQIVQGWQGNPSFQAVNEKAAPTRYRCAVPSNGGSARRQRKMAI
jgi:hypothetical protein